MFNTLNDTQKHGFPIKHVFLPYTKRNPRRRIPTTSGFLSSKIPTTRDSMEVQNTSTSVGEIFCASFTGKNRSKDPYMEFDPTHFLEWSHNKWHPGRLAWNLRLHPWKREKSSEQSHYFTLFSASMWIFGGVYHIEILPNLKALSRTGGVRNPEISRSHPAPPTSPRGRPSPPAHALRRQARLAPSLDKSP